MWRLINGPAVVASACSRRGGFVEHEMGTNKLLREIRTDGALRSQLLRSMNEAADADGTKLHLLLPQSVTLDDVDVSAALLDTHLVVVQRGDGPGSARRFVSRNGLEGTWAADGQILVRGMQCLDEWSEGPAATLNGEPPHRDATPGIFAAAGGGGRVDSGRRGSVPAVVRLVAAPQLEELLVLRETHLNPAEGAAEGLPLPAPLPLVIISAPLLYPGCAWKALDALALCTHRFDHATVASLRVDDLPQLLLEYKILARAWLEAARRREVADGAASEGQGSDGPRAAHAAAVHAPTVERAPGAAFEVQASGRSRDIGARRFAQPK